MLSFTSFLPDFSTPWLHSIQLLTVLMNLNTRLHFRSKKICPPFLAFYLCLLSHRVCACKLAYFFLCVTVLLESFSLLHHLCLRVKAAIQSCQGTIRISDAKHKYYTFSLKSTIYWLSSPSYTILISTQLFKRRVWIVEHFWIQMFKPCLTFP